MGRKSQLILYNTIHSKRLSFLKVFFSIILKNDAIMQKTKTREDEEYEQNATRIKFDWVLYWRP